MKSEINYRSKHGVAAVQLILTIQSKEKRSLTHKTFQKIQEPISTTKRCEECRNYYIRTFKRKRKIRGKPRLKDMKPVFLPVAFH